MEIYKASITTYIDKQGEILEIIGAYIEIVTTYCEHNFFRKTTNNFNLLHFSVANICFDANLTFETVHTS